MLYDIKKYMGEFMKRFRILVSVLLFIFSFAGVSFAQYSGEHDKGSWYIGFGLGSGRLQVEGETMSEAFSGSGADVGTPITLNFAVGGVLTPQMLLGLDISAIRQTVSDDFDAELSYQVNNYLCALTYYPMTEGVFLKAGAGLSAIGYDYSEPGYSEGDSYLGWGGLIGLGYDFWLGDTFNLGIHAEYSMQRYSDSEAPDDSDFLSIYVSFYWL